MIYKYLSQHHKNNKGFSLVEVLVAVSVLLLIMVGPMTIIVQSNRSASFATDQATAYFLAQEGLELAQNIRDKYQLEYIVNSVIDPWDSFKSDVVDCDASDGCSLEMNSGTDPDVTVTDCGHWPDPCRLYLDKDTSAGERKHFTYDLPTLASPKTKTAYQRVIKINFNGAEAEVVSTVKWRSDNMLAESKVEVKTFLYDIYGT